MHHHHTPLFSPDHIAVIVAVGTLICLLGAAFAISWRDSGDKLRSILSEIDSPAYDQRPGPACGSSPPTKRGPQYAHPTTARNHDDRPRQPNQIEP
jgi:hypothetical protein